MMSQSTGQSEDRIPPSGLYLRLGIHWSCVLQQELRNFTVACSGGHMEGGLHFLVGGDTGSSVTSQSSSKTLTVNGLISSFLYGRSGSAHQLIHSLFNM